MTETLYFLGRFHVLLLHLPIGILLLAVALEVASRRARFAYLAPAVGAVWLLGGLAAIATAVLGYLHALEGGFSAAAVDAHRNAGISSAVLATITWLARARLASVYDKAWPVFSLAVVAALVMTGHLGGTLTHGAEYLAMPRAKPKDVDSADLYRDVVAPAFEQRCSSCHNDGKRKGGLSLAHYETVMKGGEHGPVIVAGDEKHSDLVRRISLPPTDNDFMPHDGKTPLSAEQTAAIRWWVAKGAPRTATIAALEPSPDLRGSLATVLGLKSPASGALELANGSASSPSAPVVDVPMPDAGVADALETKGFVVRAIAAGSPLVHIDYTANRPVTDEDLAVLAKLSRQIYTLNLRNAGLSDAQLAILGRFENLVALRLELNPIGDAGLERLKPLHKLAYLNLYGTKVSDAGLATLATLPALRAVFLWQTTITSTALAEFRRAHDAVRVVDGFDPKTFPEGPQVIPIVN
jgi:hypothetical protein